MADPAKRIQHRMRDIRGQLDHDVSTPVTSAKSIADWRAYVRKYPWICLGGALAIGYFAVPKRVEVRQPDVDTLLKLAEKNKLVVQANPEPQERRGAMHQLLRFATNAAVRGALAYAGHQMGRLTAESGGEPAAGE